MKSIGNRPARAKKTQTAPAAVESNRQLLLSSIRDVLIRLEDTIIFALIERAQFSRNAFIYRRGALEQAIGGRSLLDYLLFETEAIHARLRRYTSPDEEPFSDNLPAPILPPLSFPENPLALNRVNLNPAIRAAYEAEIVPLLCPPGDDAQYGSSALCDVACLQALSKRIHYGRFVAESKYREAPEQFARLVGAGDTAALLAAITDAAVEARVLERVEGKARAYGVETGSASGKAKIDAGRVVEVYSRWIIPLTKEVQVQYLRERLAAI